MLSLGVDMTAVPFGPICKAPKASGGFYTRSTTSTEIAEFLNEALQLEGEDIVTSHTLKATTLSWASKYGLDEPTRTLLGHHQLHGDRSLSAYSRDMLSRPLALYQAMLKNIRAGPGWLLFTRPESFRQNFKALRRRSRSCWDW